jgi:hypothetical protein
MNDDDIGISMAPYILNGHERERERERGVFICFLIPRRWNAFSFFQFCGVFIFLPLLSSM